MLQRLSNFSKITNVDGGSSLAEGFSIWFVSSISSYLPLSLLVEKGCFENQVQE
jgi:hypothetical protein